MMKPIYNKIILLMIIFIGIVQINGCSNNDMWITKVKLEEPLVIDFVTYWGEETPRGRLIKQLVNNYNLYRDDEIIVNLRTIFTIEDYKSELKTLVATNLLPDIFILEQNKDDLSIELSGKLMDFSSFLNKEEWLKKDVKYLREGYVENKLLSLCFEYPTIRLFFHEDVSEEQGFFQMSDSTKLIFNLFNRLINSEENPIMVNYLEQGRSAIDFFYYLIAQKKDFDYNSKADWEEVLKLWKGFCEGLGVIENSNSYETVMNWIDKETLCYIDDSSLFSRIPIGENIDSVILTDAEGKALRGSPIGFAAAKQNNKVKEKEVLLFLEYLISSSDFVAKTTPKAQNEFIIFNLEEGPVLKSRGLNPRKQEKITELLRSIITKQRDIEHVAAELVELYK